MMESLISVAQESPALYLNNGVLLSDMKNMAETLFLALRSVTGKHHHPLLELNFQNCSFISVPSYLLCRINVNVIG
jgi:hypothetical protein